MKATRAVHFTRVWVNSPGDGTFHRLLAELHSSQHLDTELEQCVFECWPSRWMEALHPARENASQPLYFFHPDFVDTDCYSQSQPNHARSFVWFLDFGQTSSSCLRGYSLLAPVLTIFERFLNHSSQMSTHCRRAGKLARFIAPLARLFWTGYHPDLENP